MVILKRSLLVFVGLITILGSVLSIRMIDWASFSAPRPPTDDREISPSKATLISFTIGDEGNPQAEHVKEVCSGDDFFITGSVRLVSRDYKWAEPRNFRNRSNQRKYEEKRKIAIRIELHRRASGQSGYKCVGSGTSRLQGEKKLRSEFTCRVKTNAKAGLYRLAIDLIEYDDFHSATNPQLVEGLHTEEIRLVDCLSESP